MKNRDIIDFMVRSAKQAGEVLEGYFESKYGQRQKSGPEDIVTDADMEAEKIILEKLAESFPDDSIIAEESGSRGVRGAKHTWLVDPLDGTWNFAHGSKDWGVMISRAAETVELAVIWCPLLELLATAIRGEGVFVNGQRKEVARKTNEKEMLRVVRMVKPGRGSEYFVRLRQRLGDEGVDPMYRSAAVNCVRTLQGQTDVRVSTPPGQVWDHSPVTLMLAEAGMKVTNHQGKKFVWHRDTEGFIAAEPDLHAVLVKEITRLSSEGKERA